MASSDRTDLELTASRVAAEALTRIFGSGATPEQRYRAMVDHTLQFVGLVAPDGMLLDANQTALDFVGATRADVIGHPLWETRWWAGSPEARERLKSAVAEAAAGSLVRYEVSLTGAEGRRMTLDFSLKPLFDRTGRVALLIPEGRDITDRKAVEEALRVSEAKFAGIVSIAADAIVTVDEEQRIVLFNAGAEQIFDYPADEVLGQPLDLLIPERNREVHRRHMAEFAGSPVVARRMGERREIFGRRRGGELFPAEASISKIEVEGKRFFTAVLRDVTARKKAEDEMQRLLGAEESARRLAEAAEERAMFLADAGALLDRSLDVVATLRSLARLVVPRLADFCIIDVLDLAGESQRLEALHADPARRAIAETIRVFPLDRSRPFLTRRALIEGQPELVSQVTEEILATYGQSEAHLETLRALEPRSFMSVPLNARGHTLGAIAFVSSTTERQYDRPDLDLALNLAGRAALAVDNARLYEQARRATDLRDEVLSVVSHDLRNPLSVISMAATTLLDETPLTRRKIDELAQMVRESSDWMHRLIGDLLDVASIEAGRLSLDARAVDPLIVIVQAVAMLEPLAADRNVALETTLPDHLSAIRADPDRLVQVLSNVVGNAIKFTEPGGRITVSAHEDGGDVRIVIADTGCGIPAEQLPYVFDRFWHAQRESSVRSTGLGLAIARGIIEAHGGRIWAESRLGAGSTFSFTIPVASDRPVLPRLQQQSATAAE